MMGLTSGAIILWRVQDKAACRLPHDDYLHVSELPDPATVGVTPSIACSKRQIQWPIWIHAATMIQFTWLHDTRAVAQFIKDYIDAHGDPGPEGQALKAKHQVSPTWLEMM